MSDRSWTITGVNSGQTFFQQVVAVDAIAESDVKGLLQRLASRHLSEADVVAASLSSDYRAPALLITETRDGPFGFTTDATLPIYYTAILSEVTPEDSDEDPVEDTAEDPDA